MVNMIAHDIESKERTEDVQIEESVTFDTMLLPEFILQGLAAVGFKKPSPVQLVAIPRARLGLDLIVQAKSGTGKTLVFTVTALESINLSIRRVQVIILAPTREIAFQISDVIRTIGKTMKGLHVGLFVGGVPISADKPQINACHIAVGCPGRIRHLIEQNLLNTTAVRLFVLDEADKLFDPECDYHRDINYIFNKCCESKQVLALSATYPSQLLQFTQRFMRSGQHVTPKGGPAPVLLGLRQFVIISNDHPDYNARMTMKEKELYKLLESVSFDVCCIFHHYSSRAESMNNVLLKKGFFSTCLTAKQTMEQRQMALDALRSGKCRILVTSDIAARGIDCPSINLVINMGVPWNQASYLHRMGRAGRFGSQGVCISLISDGIELKKFQKLLGQIGGTSMAVNVFPKIRKFDVWNDDLDDFDKIYGIVSSESDDELSEPNAAILTKQIVAQNNNENIYVEKELANLHITDKNKTNARTDNVVGEKSNKRLKKMNIFSLKELQSELDKFVGNERKLKNDRSKKRDRAVKNTAPTYSQILSGYKKCDIPKSESNSSIEVIDVQDSPEKDSFLRNSLNSTSLCAIGSCMCNSAMDVSTKNKRKRGHCYCSSSSEFERGSYSLDSSCSDDDTMYTVDDDTRSGIDLNAENNDSESASEISCEVCGLDRIDGYSCKNCGMNQSSKYHDSNQTDWFSMISYQIHAYVRYSRQLRSAQSY